MTRDKGRRLLWALALTTLAALALPADRAAAAPVPSQGASATAAQTDAAAVAAERALLQAQLAGFGLTEREAADRVALLTDEEVHAIVADPDALRVVAGDIGEEAAVAVLAVTFILAYWHHWTHG